MISGPLYIATKANVAVAKKLNAAFADIAAVHTPRLNTSVTRAIRAIKLAFGFIEPLNFPAVSIDTLESSERTIVVITPKALKINGLVAKNLSRSTKSWKLKGFTC